MDHSTYNPEIESKFQRGSQITGTPSEREWDGKKRFVRKLFGLKGLFYNITTKSLEEVILLLTDIGIATSNQEASDIVGYLVKHEIEYDSTEYAGSFRVGAAGVGRGQYRKELATTQVQTSSGEIKLRFLKYR